MEYKKLIEKAYQEEQIKKLEENHVLLALEGRFFEQPDTERMMQLMDCLTDSLVLVPMNAKISEKDAEIMKNGKIGDEISLQEDIRMTPDYLKDSEGKLYIPIFSEEDQVDKEYINHFSTVWLHISEVINLYNHPREALEGIVLDPHTHPIEFSKPHIEMIELVMKYKEEELEKNK